MKNRLNNFTIVNNSVLSNKELSLGAKGLYAFLASKPENWTFSYKGLASQLKESEKTIRRFVKELVESKILLRIPTVTERNGLKFGDYDWILHPTKQDLKAHNDPIEPSKDIKQVKASSADSHSLEKNKNDFINFLRFNYAGVDNSVIVAKVEYYFNDTGLLHLKSNGKMIVASKATKIYDLLYDKKDSLLKYYKSKNG